MRGRIVVAAKTTTNTYNCTRSSAANGARMKKILVTGGSGFLGLETVRKLAARGDTAIAFDTQVTAPLADLARSSANVIPIAGDITDLANLAQVFGKERPDAVLHFAAIVGVPASLGSPANILRVNVQG